MDAVDSQVIELLAALRRPGADVERLVREALALVTGNGGLGDADRAALAQVLELSRDRAVVALAHELALRAAAVPGARSSAARSFDRLRVLDGLPQKFGTQRGLDGREWPCDPTTTDSERRKWGLPPLAELLRRGGS